MDGRVLRQVGRSVAGSGLFVKYFSGAILGALGGVCWVSTHIAMRPLFLSKAEDCLGSKLIEVRRSALLASSTTLSTANVISLSKRSLFGVSEQ